ncbi:hypothetical protein BH09BAC1_BH09BAC1_01790 [soil metagenome]
MILSFSCNSVFRSFVSLIQRNVNLNVLSEREQIVKRYKLVVELILLPVKYFDNLSTSALTAMANILRIVYLIDVLSANVSKHPMNGFKTQLNGQKRCKYR